MPTYVVTLTTAQRRVLFLTPENARILLDVLFHRRDEGRYLLHGFAILPVQVHLLLTPLCERTAERCTQGVREAFARAVRLKIPGALWQGWDPERRVRSEQEFEAELGKIAALPGLRGLRGYGFVHTQWLGWVDVMPESLRLVQV